MHMISITTLHACTRAWSHRSFAPTVPFCCSDSCDTPEMQVKLLKQDIQRALKQADDSQCFGRPQAG